MSGKQETLKVLGISGSLRKNSFNTGLIKAARKLKPDYMEIESADISNLPLYNQDLEAAGLPEPVRKLRDQIAAADALLIATPEYNYSVPGVLKNAIDWSSRPPKDSPLKGKVFAVMGAGGRMGTSRAQYHLRQIAVFTDMHTFNKPEVTVTDAREKFDAEGNLTDERTADQIRRLLESLAQWVEKLKD
jgi:chromate reductase